MAPVGHRPGFMNLPDLRWLSPPKWKPPEKEAPPLDQEAKPSTENALSKKQGAKQNARSRTPDKGSPPPRQGRLWETFAARGETLVPFRQKDQSPPKKRVNDQPRDTEPANLKGAEISIPVRWPVPALPMPLEQGRATGDTVTVACNAALSSAEKGNGAAHRDELCTLNGMEGPPLAKPSSPPAQPFEVKLLVRERKVPAVQLFPHAAAPPAVVPPPLAVPPPSAEPPLTPPEVIARGRFFSPPCAARDKVLLSPSLRVGTTALRGRVADLISPGRPFRSPRSKFFSPPRYRGKLLKKHLARSSEEEEAATNSSAALNGSSGLVQGCTITGAQTGGSRVRFWWLKEQEEQSRGSDRGRTGKESSPGKSESQRGTVAKSPGKPASFREELSSSPHRQSIKALEGLFGRQELGQRRIPFEVDIEVAGRSGPERVQERVVSNGAPSHAARPLTLNPSSVSLFLDTDEAEEAAGTGAAQSWCQAEQVREAELDKDPHSAGSADSPREFGGLLDGALEKLEALALACRLEDLKLTGGVNWAGDNNEKEAGIVTGGSYRGDDAWVEEADLTGGDAIQAEARKGKEAGLKTGENDRDNDAGIKETNLGIGQTKRGQNAEKEGRVFETGNFDQGEETGVKPPGAKTGGKRRVTAERRVQSRGGQTGTNRGETGGSRIQAGVQVPSAPVTAQKGTFMIGGEPNLTRRADLFQPTEQKMSTANVLRLDVTPQLSIPFADPNVKSDADSDADPEAVPQDLGVRVERSDEPARSESGSPGVAEAESSGRLKTAPGRQNDTESTERVLEMYVEKLKESTAFSLDVSSRLQNPADGSAGRDSEVSFASGELRGELDPLGTETDGRSEHTDASEPGIPPGSVQESVSVSVFALNLCGRAEMVSTRGFDRAAVDGQLKETAAPEEGEKPSAILESEKLAAALRIAETFTNPRLLPDEPLGALLGADSEGLRLDVDLERFGDFNEQEPDTVNAFEGASSVEDRGSLRGCEDEPARKALLGGEAEKAKGTEKSEMREKRIEIESRGQVEGGLKEGLRSRQESVTVERAEQTIEQTDTESEHRDSVKRMERELERDEPGLRLEVEKAEPTKQSLEDLAQLDWDSILSGDVDSCVRHLLDSPQCQRRSWASGEGADSRPISPPWKDRGRASASRGGADARPTSPPWKNKIMPEIPLLGGSLAGTQEAQSGGSGSRPQSPPQKDANPAIASGWGAISRPGSPLCRSQSLPTEFSSVGSPGAAWLEPGGGLHSLLGSPPWSVQNFPEVNLLVGSPGAARDAFRRWTVPGSPGVSGSAEPAGVRFRETRDVGFLRAVAGWEPGLGGKAGAERSGRGRADSGGMAGAEAGKAPALESRAEAGAAPGPQPGGTVGADSENGTTAETGAKVGTRVEGSSAAVSVERDVPVRREAERAELEISPSKERHLAEMEPEVEEFSSGNEPQPKRRDAERRSSDYLSRPRRLQPRPSCAALLLPCAPYDEDGRAEDHATWQPEKVAADRLRVLADKEGIHTDGSEGLTPGVTPRCGTAPGRRFFRDTDAPERVSKPSNLSSTVLSSETPSANGPPEPEPETPRSPDVSRSTDSFLSADVHSSADTETLKSPDVMRSADVSRSADVRSLADEETLQSLDASSSADGVLSADVRSSADVGSPTDADNLRSADALPAEDSARPALPAPTTGASSEHSTVQLSFGDGFSKQTSGELTSQVFAAERLPEPAAEGPTECDFAGERPSQSALVRITDQRFARTELPQPASSEQTHQVSPQENPLWSASKERTAQNSAEIELPWLASVERAKQDSIKDSLPRSASLERIAQASAGPEPPRSVSAERTAQVFVEDSQTLSASVERTAQDPAKPEQLPSAEDSVERLSSGEWTGTDWQIGEVLERFRIRVRAESNYPVARRHSRAAQKPLSGIISPRDQGKSARLSDPGSGEVARGDADAGSQGRLNPPTEVTENPVALPSTRATERSLSSLSSAEDQRTSARLSHPGSGDDAAVARFAAGSTNARASEVALDEMGTGQPRFNAAIAGEFGDPDLVPVVREPEAESGDGASNSGTGVGNDEVRKESGKDEIKGAERIADSVGSSYPMDRTVPVSAGGPAVPEGVLGGGERTPDWLVRNQVVDEEEGHFAPPGGTGRRPAPPSELRDGHESDPKGVKPEVAQPGGKELGSGNLLNEELLKPRSRMGGSDRALRARETETPEENEVAAGEQPVQHVAATLSLSLGAPEAHDVSAWEGKPGHNEGDGGSRKVAAGASPGAVMEEQEGENETRLAEAGKGAKVAERSFPVTTKAAELQRTEQAETERMTDVWVALSPRIWERPAALAPGAEHEVEVFNFAAWESDKDGTEQVPAEREGTLDGMERVLAEREAETKEGGKSEGAGLRGIDSGGLASNGNSVDGVVVGGSSVGGMRPSENESNGTELDGTESDGIESEGASLETTGLDRNTSEHPIVDELSLEETSLDRNTFGETCWDGTNADGTNPDGISLSGTSLDGPNSNGTRANATSPSGTGVGGTSLDGNGQEGAISDATTLDGKNLGGTGLGSGGTAVLPKLKLGPRAEQRAVPASERERRSAAEAEAPAVAMELSEFRPALKQVKTRMKSSPERVKVRSPRKRNGFAATSLVNGRAVLGTSLSLARKQEIADVSVDSFLNWDSIVGGEQSGAGGGIDAGVESVSGGALEFGNAGGLGTGFVVGLEAGAVDALRPVSDGGLESGSGGALTGVPPKPLTASAVESRVNTAGTTEAVTVSGTSSVSASDLGTASDQDQKTVLASSFISDFADISEAPSVVDDELGLEADGEPGSDSGFDAVSTSGPKDVDAGRGADSAASTPERNGVTDTRALQGGAERSNGAPLTTELRVAPWNEILAESRLGLLEGEQTEKSNETSPAGASSHRPESALMSPEPVILASTEQSGRTQTQERTAAEPLSVQESDVPNPAQNVGHDVAEADVAGLDRSRESDVGPEVEGFTVAEDGWTELTRPESARAEGRIPRQEERDVEILEGEGIMMASVLFEEDAEEGSAAQKAGAGSGKLSWTEGAERECVRAEWFEMEESWVGDAFEKESRLDGEQKGECLEGFSAGDIPAEEAVDEGIPAELGSVSGTLAEGLNILEKMEDGDFTTKQKAPSTGNEVPAEWVRKLWRNWAEGAATGPRPTSAGEDGCSTEATLGPQLRRGVLAERRPVEVECNAPESAEEAESSLESGSTDDHSKRSAETETARAESDTGTKAAGFRPAEKVPAERTRLAEQTRAERIQGDRRWTVVDVPKTEADTATKIRSSETAELPKRKGRSPDSPEERLDPILLLFAQGGTSETILSSSVPIPLTAELLKTERKRTVERGREEPGTTGPEICAAETEQRRSTGVSTGSRASDGVEVLLQGLVAEEDDVSGESGSDSDGEFDSGQPKRVSSIKFVTFDDGDDSSYDRRLLAAAQETRRASLSARGAEVRASVARLTHLLENEEPIEVLGGWARLPGSRKGQRSVSYTGVCEEHGLGKGLEGERVGFGERSSGVRRRSFDEGVLRRDDKKVEKRSGADVRLTEITFGGPEEALRTGREGAEQASAEQTPAEPEVATTEPTLGSATDSDNSEAHGRNVAADVTGEIADAIADPIGANGNVTEFEVEKGLEDGNIVCRAGWPRDKLEMPGFEGLAAKGASARAVTTAEIPGGTGERNGLSASEERLGKDGGAEGLQTERQRKAGRKSVNAVVDSGEEAETGSANRTESEKGSDGFVDHEGEHKHIGAGLQTERGPRSGTEVLQSTVEAAVSEPAITGVRKGDPGTRLLYEAVGDCDRKKARPKGREPKDDQSKISELIETSAKVDIPAPLGELPGFRRPALLTEALLLSSIGTGESAGSHGTEGRGESQREGREPNREEGKQVLHHKSGRASDGERKGLQPVSAARSNDKKDSERASGRLFNVTAKTAESPQKRVSYGTKLPGQRASFEFDRRSRDSQSDSDQDHWSGWRILRKEPEAKQPPRQIRKSSGRTPETEGPAGESRIFRKAPAPEKKRASGNSERRATDERRTSLSSTRVSRASDDVRLTKPAAPVESTKTNRPPAVPLSSQNANRRTSVSAPRQSPGSKTSRENSPRLSPGSKTSLENSPHPTPGSKGSQENSPHLIPGSKTSLRSTLEPHDPFSDLISHDGTEPEERASEKGTAAKERIRKVASDRPPLGRLSGRARAKVDAHATERADGSAGQRRVSREGQARPAAAGSAVGRDSAARRTRATVEGLSGRGGSPPTVTGSYVSLMVQKRALTPGALTSQERQPATLASSTRGQEPGDMSASSAGTPALSSGQSRPAVGKGKSKSDPEFRRNSVQERRNRAETIREGASYLVEDTGPIGWDFAFNPFSKISRASDPGIGTGRKVADNSRWPVSAHLRQLSLKRGGGSARA